MRWTADCEGGIGPVLLCVTWHTTVSAKFNSCLLWASSNFSYLTRDYKFQSGSLERGKVWTHGLANVKIKGKGSVLINWPSGFSTQLPLQSCSPSISNTALLRSGHPRAHCSFHPHTCTTHTSIPALGHALLNSGTPGYVVKWQEFFFLQQWIYITSFYQFIGDYL